MLKKFLIERSVPGIGNSSIGEFHQMTHISNDVLKTMGPDIQWRESFVSEDKIFCVYYATDENIIREHARRANFPIDHIFEIKSVLDPTTTTHGIETISEFNRKGPIDLQLS